MAISRAQYAIAACVAAVAAATAASLRYFGRYQPYADLYGSGWNQNNSTDGLALSDAVVFGANRGRKRWTIRAQTIRIGRDQRTVTAAGLHGGVLYGSNGRPAAQLQAGAAEYASPTVIGDGSSQGTMTLDGGLHVKLLSRGMPTLTAPRVTWEPFRQLMTCPGPITVAYPHDVAILAGRDAVWDMQSGTLSIGHNTGTFRLKDGMLP